MCTSTENLILCSCANTPKPVIHHKHSKKWKKKQNVSDAPVFIWTLFKYVEKADGYEIGSIIFPSRWLTKEISSECILEELNKRNCFDFEYTPTEKDELKIGIKDDYRIYLSFAFKNGRWEEDFSYLFSEIYEKHKDGIVKF